MNELSEVLPCEGEIKIARDGSWYHHGRPIARFELVKLFSTVLLRRDDGSYWLETPVEKVRVDVEDAPLLAVELRREGEGVTQRLDLRTNLDHWFPINQSHSIRMMANTDWLGPVPYVPVERGLDARIVTSVYYELAELAQSDDRGHFGVWSYGYFHELETAA